MSDKIQMTEEQYEEIFNETICGVANFENSLKFAKEYGYIKKSELEIARENYLKYSEMYYSPAAGSIYVNELEKEIKRLNKIIENNELSKDI
jgi:hypothetical protein